MSLFDNSNSNNKSQDQNNDNAENKTQENFESDQQNNKETESYNQKEQEDKSQNQENNQQDTEAGTTYRFGVNAPDPVPKQEQQAPQNNPSPYQQQGEQQYGGWQQQPSYQQQGEQQYGGWQPQPPHQHGDYQQHNTPIPPNGKPPKKKKGAVIAISILSLVCIIAIVVVVVLFAKTLDPAKKPPTDTSNAQVEGGANNDKDSGKAEPSVNKDAPELQVEKDPNNEGGYTDKQIIKMNVDSTVVINTYIKSKSVDYGGFSIEKNIEEENLAGTASGIVWKSDGYIITNHHVVVNEKTGKPFDRIEVVFYSKDRNKKGPVVESAKIVGADKFTDLAVIKIDTSELDEKPKEATFGKSSTLELGDRVIALGNAGGLEWTATKGIVSGLAREVYQDSSFAIKCLQVDAAINPGNSGGPLLNSSGQVVAINSAKIVASGYEGLGFSIPIEEAIEVINDLAKYGKVKGRVMLGIQATYVSTPFDAVRIMGIEDDSCFKGTKAREGDYITHVNKKRIISFDALRDEVNKHKVGDTITVTLVRFDQNGQQSKFDVSCVLKEVSS